ncbi:MAG TPA: MraY family glycosyltransferase, partial [Pirellulales bacterium]|nr:MraY family glycosyltransferase [Pirellulales bacterium]
MISLYALIGLAVAAVTASAIATPIVRWLATRLGLVDAPDGSRKIHGRAIALGGGVAVLLSTALVMIAALAGPLANLNPTGEHRRLLAGLAAAAVVLCLVGLFDDYFELRARHKLLGQITASLIVMSSGLVIHSVELFGQHLELGLLAWPFSLFWLLGAINSVNLIDGADGLATTVGIILCSTIAAVSWMTGQELSCMLALCLAGSLVGFLIFNFPPASIFLGDAGSMLIGLVAGTLAIFGCVKGAASVAMAAPVAIWAIPAFDCGIAIVRRKMTGRSMCTTDRGHLHHCLLRRGYDNRQMLAWVAGLCGFTAVAALLSLYFKNEAIAAAGVVIVVSVLVTTRLFGHAEFLLVTNSFMNIGASLFSPGRRDRRTVRKKTIHLQGSRKWEPLWDVLTAAAAQLELSSLRLNMNLPWLHENYHATWNREHTEAAHDLWHADFPLQVQGRTVGHLRASGSTRNAAASEWVIKFAELVSSLEDQLSMLAREPAASEPRT